MGPVWRCSDDCDVQQSSLWNNSAHRNTVQTFLPLHFALWARNTWRDFRQICRSEKVHVQFLFVRPHKGRSSQWGFQLRMCDKCHQHALPGGGVFGDCGRYVGFHLQNLWLAPLPRVVCAQRTSENWWREENERMPTWHVWLLLALELVGRLQNRDLQLAQSHGQGTIHVTNCQSLLQATDAAEWRPVQSERCLFWHLLHSGKIVCGIRRAGRCFPARRHLPWNSHSDYFPLPGKHRWLWTTERHCKLGDGERPGLDELQQRKILGEVVSSSHKMELPRKWKPEFQNDVLRQTAAVFTWQVRPTGRLASVEILTSTKNENNFPLVVLFFQQVFLAARGWKRHRRCACPPPTGGHPLTWPLLWRSILVDLKTIKLREVMSALSLTQALGVDA